MPVDFTGFAVSLGVTQASIEYVREGMDEIKDDNRQRNATQAAHAVMLANHGGRLDGHDRQFEERAPVKTSWPQIAMFIIGVSSLALTGAVLIFNR